MKLTRGNAWRALALIIVALVLLVVLLLPAGTRPKVKARRTTSLNNLNQFFVSSPRREVDHSEKFPTAISFTNAGAMEAATSGNVATATNRLVVP